MNIDEFLLARIAEDEETDPFVHKSFCGSLKFPYPDSFDPGECDCGATDRWRAECAAKRRIVEREVNAANRITYRRMMVLQDLASVYEDHPDYREEWAL